MPLEFLFKSMAPYSSSSGHEKRIAVRLTISRTENKHKKIRCYGLATDANKKM